MICTSLVEVNEQGKFLHTTLDVTLSIKSITRQNDRQEK